jgi:hypothetical protein
VVRCQIRGQISLYFLYTITILCLSILLTLPCFQKTWWEICSKIRWRWNRWTWWNWAICNIPAKKKTSNKEKVFRCSQAYIQWKRGVWLYSWIAPEIQMSKPFTNII